MHVEPNSRTEFEMAETPTVHEPNGTNFEPTPGPYRFESSIRNTSHQKLF